MLHISLGNQVLVLSVLSWALAQLIKGIVQRVVDGTWSLEQFLASGGMPSSHSALVTCCAVTTGDLYGYDSGLFALACLFALVVMYDACHVRKSSGEQAKAFNLLLQSLQELQPTITHQELKVFMGHTGLQVFFGAALGLTMGLLGIFLL